MNSYKLSMCRKKIALLCLCVSLHTSANQKSDTVQVAGKNFSM